MFRLKIVSTFVILMAGLLFVVSTLLQAQLDKALDEDAEAALRRAAAIAEKTARLDEFALLEKARFVAQSEEVQHAMIAEYEGDWEYERHMGVHRQLEPIHRAFVSERQDQDAQRRNIEFNLMERSPRRHEMFMALDASGVGVAAVGRGLLSWFGEKVTDAYPVVEEVLRTGEERTDLWLWAWGPTDEKQLYRVAIVPLYHADHDGPVGVVVLGNTITDGLARQKQSLLAGWNEAVEGTTGQGRAQGFVLAPEIAIFRGSEIYGSTFSSNEQLSLAGVLFKQSSALEANKPEQLLSVELDGRTYFALVRFFPGHFRSASTPAGFAVMVDTVLAKEPLANVRSELLYAGLAFLLFGVLALLLFINQFIKPIERIEQGIQEILAGNKDYQFAQTSSHPHAESLSHSLNLMSAYLQGKRMPDEDVETQGWDDVMPSEDALNGGGNQSSGGPSVQGFMMPGMMSGTSSPDAEGEDSQAADGEEKT